MTVAQRNALRNRITALGYSVAELDAALPGDLRDRTLLEALRFIATRRRRVRLDPDSEKLDRRRARAAVCPLEDVNGAVA